MKKRCKFLKCACAKGTVGIAQLKFPIIEASCRRGNLCAIKAFSHKSVTFVTFDSGREKESKFESGIAVISEIPNKENLSSMPKFEKQEMGKEKESYYKAKN